MCFSSAGCGISTLFLLPDSAEPKEAADPSRPAATAWRDQAEHEPVRNTFNFSLDFTFENPAQRNEPAVRPETIRRWANRTSTAMGIEMITTAASIRL